MCSGEHARVRSWRLQFYPFSLLTGNDTGGMHHFQLDQVFSLQLGAGRFALKESPAQKKAGQPPTAPPSWYPGSGEEMEKA